MQSTIQTIDQDLEVIPFWSEFSKTKQATYVDHAYYIVLRGIMCKRHQPAMIQIARLKKAFGPVTNTTKLQNGRKPYDTLRATLWNLQWTKPTFPVSEYQRQAVIAKAKELYGLVYAV
jgi:hypothetical protein